MPNGIIVMKWDIRQGIDIKGLYPENISFEEKALFQIYLQHENTGKKGRVSLRSDSTHFVSYYTGPKKKIYVILLLKVVEDGDEYEDFLIELSDVILEYLDSSKLEEKLPLLYQSVMKFSDKFQNLDGI